MIARALAQRTKVMILDEPTAFLDWPNRVDLLINLKQIANEENKAVLISSHDLSLFCRSRMKFGCWQLTRALSREEPGSSWKTERYKKLFHPDMGIFCRSIPSYPQITA